MRRSRTIGIAGAILAITAAPARAQSWSESLEMMPPTWEFGGYELRLGGYAGAAAFSTSQDGYDDDGITGQVRADIRLQTILDNGLTLGARSIFLLHHDELSGDRYGNDFFQKVYVYAQTGLGRIEIGQQDGPGYILGLTGPKVDPHVGLDDADTTFFFDPSSDSTFDAFFRPLSAVGSSGAYTKLSYTSPRLFGAQIGLSYAPNPVKAPLPGVGNPSNDANSQGGIWEAAGSYITRFGDLTAGVSLAYATGSVRKETPGHDNLSDWALGLEFAYNLDGVRLLAGGAYRESNAYGFQIRQALSNADTSLIHVSAGAEIGDWRLGGEYSYGEMEGTGTLPSFTMDAYQLAVGYVFNSNMQVTAGWQWRDYERDAGLFYNGQNTVGMNAGFLALGYSL